MEDYALPPGPGKTAPRLINDLLDYDPRYLKSNNGKNVLADDAPQYKGKSLLRKGVQDCRHTLMKKVEQTDSPVSNDERPDESTRYVVATYCSTCRYHFQISVDFSQRKGRKVPCRLDDVANPLHHLRLVRSMDAQEYEDKHGFNKYDRVTEAHRFACSGATCPVIVDINISPPRLSRKMLSLITDPKKMTIRGRKVIAAEPIRFPDSLTHLPLQALGNLRQYLKDAQAIRDPSEIKKIAKRNKRFVLSFADECESLFEYLDFKTIEETNSSDPDDEPNYFWQLPVITDMNRNFISDVLVELDLVIGESPPVEQQMLKTLVTHTPLPALKDIKRSLGFLDYPKSSRIIDLSKEEHPYYASLGAVDNFTDDLLIWAYDRQRECDPPNRPYYLDCLTDLAKGRDSSDLQTKVVMATSAGECGQKEIDGAYKFFALDPATKEGDDHIIGVYNSRIESAPRQKDEARRCLRVIAKDKNSEKIEAVANDQTMSYEEALEFLSVSEDTESDIIEASAVAMASESSDRSRVARALRVIASRRANDYVLQRAASNLETGNGEPTLDIGDAYRRLQIDNRTVPDETVLAYYHSLSNDAPAGSKDSYTEALRVIALDRQSTFLLMKLDDPNADVQATRTTAEQPVGLENIGNTCYLNSLLQFIYTVKPVRDVVMNFDSYRMDLQDGGIVQPEKRVGGLVIDRAEIVEAQKFVQELHTLFENLRTASTRSVRPTKQLAKATLISKKIESVFREFRKQSMSSPSGPPNIALLMNGPVYGPQLPPSVTSRPSPTPEEDIEMVDRPGETTFENGSDSSEATLINMESEQEQPPPYSDSQGAHLFPGNETSEKGNLGYQINLDDDAVMVNGENSSSESYFPAAPEKPPPVPPRNKAGLSIQTNGNKEITDKEDDGLLWQQGLQQDVTEVIANVINLLQAAIKPTGVNEAGEQTDKIWDTFYGTSATYTQKPQKLEKKLESWNSLMVYPDGKGSRDIYEALDVNYDEQMVEIGKAHVPQYTSITKLPPVLQIQIQRTAWSQGTGGSKNSNPVIFPETIYLDRYMDSEDPASPLMNRRRQAWKWKATLRDLEARQAALKVTEAELSVPDALLETRNFLDKVQEAELEDVEVDPSLSEALEARMSEVAEELDFISHQIAIVRQKLNEQFTNMRVYEYKLQTVFIHRGESGSGHYWVYVYDFENDVWREYNDEYVTIVQDRKRIFEHKGAGSGTPYYLAYVRSADHKDLVNAVFRDVREVEMTDVPESWAGHLDAQMDEGISMEHDGDDGDVRHVEHAKPRPLLPKPVQNSIEGWDSFRDDGRDANGRQW